MYFYRYLHFLIIINLSFFNYSQSVPSSQTTEPMETGLSQESRTPPSSQLQQSMESTPSRLEQQQQSMEAHINTVIAKMFRVNFTVSLSLN